MRHARAEDLDRIGELLEGLRQLPELTERSPGSFYRRSSGFVHFHIDGDDVWADVKVPGPTFERRLATTGAQQRALLASIRAHITS